MKITDWKSMSDWVKSIGPTKASLSIEYILSIPNKEREGWRRRVMKFAPSCYFSGVVTSYERESRGGLMLWVSTSHIQEFPLLISKEKQSLLEKVLPKLNSNRALVITFNPYIHYQHGYIGMVKDCELCVEQVQNRIHVNTKIMPTSSLPDSKPMWNATQDHALLDALEKDLGIRAIAQKLEVSPVSLLGHMVRLKVIGNAEYLEMKSKLEELGYS
ncbi:hypothetical protein OCT63_20500 [Vibrio sp. RW]|uniref:hypothetical protein n=1 Tax=Vibrio sp. RW TaxID=2998833 RepID=UPI0022CD5CD2|nr:hypothetical protein [Vibrio sp. RW]MDA0146606.1 hypothetical protein [Vibrio sp. RW]